MNRRRAVDNKRPKGKPTKSKARRQPRPTRPARRTNPISPILRSEICGLTDPFCKHAYGAKYPDQSATRTLPWTFHGRATLSTDASGNAGFLFIPNYYYSPIVTGTITGTASAPLLGTTTFSAAPTTVADVTRFRIVSAGYQVRRISAPLTSSGMVHIRSLTDQVGTNLNSVDLLSYSRDDYLDNPLQDSSDLSIICNRNSEPPQQMYAPTFTNVNSNVTAWNAPGFTVTSVMVAGGPVSTAVLSVEYFVHYELCFDDASSMTMMATPSPPYNSVVVDAASRVTSSMKRIYSFGLDAVSTYVERRAAQALTTLLGRPATAGLALLAP